MDIRVHNLCNTELDPVANLIRKSEGLFCWGFCLVYRECVEGS